MHPISTETVLGAWLSIRPARDDQGKGDDVFRQAAEVSKSSDSFLERVYPCPHCPKSLIVSGKKEVLSGCGTILHPKPLELFECRVAANKDTQGRQASHRRVGMDVGDGVQDLPVVNDHEMPWLLIAR